MRYFFFSTSSSLSLARAETQTKVRPFTTERRSSCMDEDDVATEKERVNLQVATEHTDPLLLVGLKKMYGSLKAVDGLSVGVAQGHCFGLLGQSGAGKTTVFRMLTGETNISSGTAFLKGFNVRNNLRAVQNQIGYCPQYDAHIGEMTASEILHLFGRLRGIPPKDLDEVVKTLVKIVLLGPYAHRRCGNYSGGNRRKLSLAMALVGDPPFLLLDEPSCGMDPKARRQMWDVLCRIRASGKTLIVSSHSMEECDALCTKLAILLNGRFMCLGSPQHLKSKYGQGYTLAIKMGALPDGSIAPSEPVVQFLQDAFPDTVIFDDHEGYVHLQIKDPAVELADVFSKMELCHKQLDVEDYSVNETTLEQVFLMFTIMQHLDEETRPQSCWFLRSGFFGDNLCF
ncbi:ATP-binding cassette sub-family a member 3 [Plakobranchus ocellatus]|uniref:ATP-binding cassette sub-family a member 3 n=1 Tax=Plakobranchus ocellatus TaxID=259542 RepID=A0AAV3YI44_9GAST|nr:ATP-binding cassette sub-family a member 3 [Plakobranchus ocellatus]